jgi:hypothetical protein
LCFLPLSCLILCHITVSILTRAKLWAVRHVSFSTAIWLSL